MSDPAMSDPAVNNTAMSGPAVNDTAVNDTAMNDTAMSGAATNAKSELREAVRARYAAAATAATEGRSASCCGPEAVAIDNSAAGRYTDADRGALPPEALAASLGCGNPLAAAELREGERVLDLGSGGGIDVLLSARRVGPGGEVYGLDTTDEMLALAEQNARRAGATGVEFRKGGMEAIPLPDGAVDVVISNCALNLSVDKPAAFAEIFRVLAPGGRIGISDVVADDELTPEQRGQRGDHAGCIAGALSTAEYREGLRTAGFADVAITTTHPVADRMRSAVVRAGKPRR